MENIGAERRVLSEEETNALIEKIHTGDENEKNVAQNELIDNNVRFVGYIVNKIIMNSKIDISFMREELMSVGMFGLFKSINTYENNREVKFLTYSSVVIRNEILIFIRNEMKYCNCLSIDEQFRYQGDSEFTLEYFLEDESSNFVSEIVDEEMRMAINDVILEWNNPRERTAIILYFGFDNHKRCTLCEIARELNCSQSYVSRIIKRALEKIKIVLIRKKIVEMPTCYLKAGQKKRRSRKHSRMTEE